METNRWAPRKELTKQEQLIVKRCKRVRKLFPFLRLYRDTIFDNQFQDELYSIYRQTGAGKCATPPAIMAMGTLIQGYLGISDAEMVELTLMDLRVQMVLDWIGKTEPAFSQGSLSNFRDRLIEHNMDRRILERTVELAKQSKLFDYRKLPKTLRIGIDSCPLEGASKVEDSINLLGHAARKVVDCAANILGLTRAEVCIESGITLLLESSIKKSLDLDWNDKGQKDEAINILVEQIDSLNEWLKKALPAEMKEPPLKQYVETVERIRNQDLEPDPKGGGSRIRKGVAEDRQVSVEDAEMRHGRKSKSKRFNGYKRHVAADLDTSIIYAAGITPANRPEEEATPKLQLDMSRLSLDIDELYIDRAYINSPTVEEVTDRKGDIICKPWNSNSGKVFPKSLFNINVRDKVIECPEGQKKHFTLGSIVEFDADICDHCKKRSECTTAELGHGRTVSISENERLQKRLRKQVKTKAGRERLRKRTGIEHRLAHISRRQGPRARYKGIRKNTLDLRRASAIQNLETIQRTSPVVCKTIEKVTVAKAA